MKKKYGIYSLKNDVVIDNITNKMGNLKNVVELDGTFLKDDNSKQLDLFEMS